MIAQTLISGILAQRIQRRAGLRESNISSRHRELRACSIVVWIFWYCDDPPCMAPKSNARSMIRLTMGLEHHRRLPKERPLGLQNLKLFFKYESSSNVGHCGSRRRKPIGYSKCTEQQKWLKRYRSSYSCHVRTCKRVRSG